MATSRTKFTFELKDLLRLDLKGSGRIPRSGCWEEFGNLFGGGVVNESGKMLAKSCSKGRALRDTNLNS